MDLFPTFSPLFVNMLWVRIYQETVQVHPLGPIVPLAAYKVPDHRVPGSPWK